MKTLSHSPRGAAPSAVAFLLIVAFASLSPVGAQEAAPPGAPPPVRVEEAPIPQPQPVPKKRGFFDRLFGDDNDERDESREEDEGDNDDDGDTRIRQVPKALPVDEDAPPVPKDIASSRASEIERTREAQPKTRVVVPSTGRMVSPDPTATVEPPPTPAPAPAPGQEIAKKQMKPTQPEPKPEADATPEPEAEKPSAPSPEVMEQQRLLAETRKELARLKGEVANVKEQLEVAKTLPPKVDVSQISIAAPDETPGPTPSETVDRAAEPPARAGSVAGSEAPSSKEVTKPAELPGNVAPSGASGGTAPNEGGESTGEVPTGTKTESPDFVRSPFPPHTKLDVKGMQPGSLAKDPTNGKVFRVP